MTFVFRVTFKCELQLQIYLSCLYGNLYFFEPFKTFVCIVLFLHFTDSLVNTLLKYLAKGFCSLKL